MEKDSHIGIATREDIPQLTALWRTCFHETQEEAELFFQKCGALATTYCYKEGAEIASMLSVFEVSIVDADKQEHRGVYVYGVATLPKYRHCGKMQRLLETACAHAKEHSFHFSCLVPANEELFGMYRRLGYQICGLLTVREGKTKTEAGSDQVSGFSAISPQKLAVLRAVYLEHIQETEERPFCYLKFSEEYICYLEKWCVYYGGGFLQYNATESAVEGEMTGYLIYVIEEHRFIVLESSIYDNQWERAVIALAREKQCTEYTVYGVPGDDSLNQSPYGMINTFETDILAPKMPVYMQLLFH